MIADFGDLIFPLEKIEQSVHGIAVVVPVAPTYLHILRIVLKT